jgi:hypothetical protein
MSARWLPRTADGVDFLDLLVFDGVGWTLYSFPLWQLPPTEVTYARRHVVRPRTTWT